MSRRDINTGSGSSHQRVLTNLTTSAGLAVTAAGAASISPTISPSAGGRGTVGPTLSLSPPTMLAVAITDSSTIPTNPSMALTSPAVTTTANPDQHVYNSTGYLVEQDDIEYGILTAFSDLQTVFLACISTLVPLIAALAIGFGVRHAWRKYRNRRNGSSGLPWYKGVCSRDDTGESLHHRSHSRSGSIQPATRILSVQDLANGVDGPRYACETESISDVVVVKSAIGNGAEYASPINHTSKNTNGNIITLTLKNNHLIVETEERAVSMDEGNQYLDNDCSFVLEAHPTNRNSSRISDERAVVHREQNPDDLASNLDKTMMFGSTNTGLSQSDLSISSQGSINHSYRYGNQVEYDAGHFDYTMYGNGTGECESDSGSRNLEGRSKWVEIEYSPDTEKTLHDASRASSTEKRSDGHYSFDNDKLPSGDSKYSSVDKQVEERPSLADNRNNSEASRNSGSSMEHQESTDGSNSTDTVRSNPNLRINGTTPNKLECMERKSLIKDFASEKKTSDSNKPVITAVLLKDETQEDTFQEQQRKLGNGTLTPEHKNNERSASNGDRKTESTSAFVPCHKRSGSIPPRLIEEIDREKSLKMYSPIKNSARSILPGLSPKFELLQNDVSPIEERES